MSKEQTFGEKAVGLGLTPSGDVGVIACKQMCAGLIDQMDRLRRSTSSADQVRLASVAITELQGAQMWAVKALTWKD